MMQEQQAAKLLRQPTKVHYSLVTPHWPLNSLTSLSLGKDPELLRTASSTILEISIAGT